MLTLRRRALRMIMRRFYATSCARRGSMCCDGARLTSWQTLMKKQKPGAHKNILTIFRQRLSGFTYSKS
jgi:hypothetical protein